MKFLFNFDRSVIVYVSFIQKQKNNEKTSIWSEYVKRTSELRKLDFVYEPGLKGWIEKLKELFDEKKTN